MAREIKFRAWVNNHDAIHFSADAGIDQLIEWVNRYGGQVMQFTGLKDRNGKEIYEGDILKSNTIDGKPCVVAYETLHARFLCGSGLVMIAPHHWVERVIIGNIYENPELLH
jgi:YopX protein